MVNKKTKKLMNHRRSRYSRKVLKKLPAKIVFFFRKKDSLITLPRRHHR